MIYLRSENGGEEVGAKLWVEARPCYLPSVSANRLAYSLFEPRIWKTSSITPVPIGGLKVSSVARTKQSADGEKKS